MQLRDALDDYKRYSGDPTRFPGERRTTRGLFSGSGGRLVHVAPDGSLRDFGYPLSGLSGLDRSRFGLRVGDDVTWFDDGGDQQYRERTTLVETVHETPLGTVAQYDVTAGDGHLTRFEVDVDVDAATVADAELLVHFGFSPDGRDSRVGQLHHDDAVELYHAAEHDFLGSATGFRERSGEASAPFEHLLSADPVPIPLDREQGRYEEDRLSGTVVGAVPLDDGTATLVSLLTDRAQTSRENALGRVAELLEEHATRDALVRRAEAEADRAVPGRQVEGEHDEAVAADLRVLSLLSAPTGLRIAGPDFDPYYVHSGGYGYTWFRDDAEISRYLLEADDHFDLGLEAWHERSARAYCTTQRADGSWPHRVWPRDGSLAPGWANARLEDGSDLDYQADQTGSVVAFLASVRDRLDADLRERVDETLALALDGLDETLEADGRPVACQNAWEDATGRFAHTAATFLEAYAALAATDHPDAERALAGAATVYAAIDDLWIPGRELYAVRETERGLDDRADSATLALVAAHRAYDRIAEVDDERLDQLVAHVDSVVGSLWRDPEDGDIAGLVRYEGDGWRQKEQPDEKVWTVSTAWGANAATGLAALLADRDDPRADRVAGTARQLLAPVMPGGALCEPTSYLPEQFFDDGTPDCATPLGWPHALRSATLALAEREGVDVGVGAESATNEKGD